MKKIVASVGLVALGASTLQAAPEITTMPGKPWSVSLSLRGFYDDNPGTQPDGEPKKGSFGFEIQPGVAVHWDNGPTKVDAGYSLSYKQFAKNPPGHEQGYFLNHNFNVEVLHAFSERTQLSFSDSFVIGQEPDLLQFGTYASIPGDNVRNYGAIALTGWFTPLWGYEFGYDNEFLDYDSDELSMFQDRMTHRFHTDARWQVMPQTTALIGYQFGITEYKHDEAEFKENRAHYIYAGATHMFSPEVTGGLKAGVRITDYYNNEDIDNRITPFVNGNLRYGYAPESYVQAGVGYDVTGTPSNAAEAASADTLSAWLSLYHRIVPRLYGNLIGRVQHSEYTAFDGEDAGSHTYLALGAKLEYWINPHLMAHVGYNFDDLSGSSGFLEYTRNRVYIGMTARY